MSDDSGTEKINEAQEEHDNEPASYDSSSEDAGTEENLNKEQDDKEKSDKSDEEFPDETKIQVEETKEKDEDDKKDGDEDEKDDDDQNIVPPQEVVTEKVVEVEDTQIFQFEEEEEIRIKRIFSSSYVSSIYENSPKKCASIRSLYPPRSWPSSAKLSVDSDVYPKESEYNLEVASLKLINTMSTVGKEESKFNLHEVLSPSTEEANDMIEKPEVEVKSIVTTKPDTFENVEEEFEENKIIDIPFLKEVLKLPIDPEAVKKICFSETLLISYEFYNKDDKEANCDCTPLFNKSNLFNSRGVQEMGGLSLNIESNDCFLTTFCTSQFSCLGSAGASRLLSVVDYEFGLIEEKKTEWHCMHDKKIEKSLHVAKDGKNFVAFRTNSEDERIERHRGDICLKATGDLVLDGGLFALMRYLIISDFCGEFETWSIHITGDICRCKFIVGIKRTLYINNIPYLVKQIKKEFYRDRRYPDISKSYFLPSGHLVRHKWRGCRYFIHINPISHIPPQKHNIEYSWKDDIMLMSKYLDEKQKRHSEIVTYMGDHPEIKSILQDYMLCLLQLKPDHVLDFTIDYFINLFRE